MDGSLLEHVEVSLTIQESLLPSPKLHSSLQSGLTNAALEAGQVILVAGANSVFLVQSEGILTSLTLRAEHLGVVLTAVELTKLFITRRLQVHVTDIALETGLVEDDGADLDEGLVIDDMAAARAELVRCLHAVCVSWANVDSILIPVTP